MKNVHVERIWNKNVKESKINRFGKNIQNLELEIFKIENLPIIYSK